MILSSRVSCPKGNSKKYLDTAHMMYPCDVLHGPKFRHDKEEILS